MKLRLEDLIYQWRVYAETMDDASYDDAAVSLEQVLKEFKEHEIL